MPYQVFPTKDGYLIIAVGNNDQFERLCKALELNDLYISSKYSDNQKRVQNREELVDIISSQTKKYSKNDLKNLLELSKVPVGTVNNLEEVFSDPHVIARNLKINMKHKNAKKSYTESVRTPIIFSDTKLNYSRGVPALGEHSDEILKELDDD